MNNINEIKWDSFILSEIFDISSTNSGIDKNKLNLESTGKTPYITRSDNNNGINMFVPIQDYELNEGNVITIGLDTQTVFYQPHPFYTGQNIQILSNKHINKYNALFIANSLKILLKKFTWGGYGATLTRLQKSRILLPVNEKNEPNYEFMEEYIKSKEKDLINVYLNHLDNLNVEIGGGEFK